LGGERINAGGAGDQHCWDVWHGRGDWAFYSGSTARFCSEFGFAAAPGHAALRRMLAGGDADPLRLPVDDRVARWHDKTAKAFETFRAMVELHYPAARDLEEWAYFTQLNQRDALRHGIEHWRRSPLCRGTLVWQLNDCWPVQSWAWVDSNLRPKAAWYAAKRFHAPLLVSLWRPAPDRLAVHLVNDTRDDVAGTLEVRVLDEHGAEVWATSVDATARSAGSVGVLDEAVPGGVLAHVTFAGRTSTLLLVEPKELRLPRPTLDVEVVGRHTLRLTSDVLALSVVLWLDGTMNDVVWSDNAFDLLPGVPHDVAFELQLGYADDEVPALLRWRSL
ncbi:MAG TPA: glycoside hydrolase family 2 protein, partial [Acidimicrobiales bacterium]|nr:glycoside hydrolase family 2 protein [Acidimicrobiales bacterium]